MGWWGSKLVHRHHQWIAFYFIGYNVRSEIWFACRMPVLSCSQFTVVRSRSLLKKMSNTRRLERHCSQQISKSLLFWCFPTCSHQVPHARENVAEISSLVIVLSISASSAAAWLVVELIPSEILRTILRHQSGRKEANTAMSKVARPMLGPVVAPALLAWKTVYWTYESI